MPRITPNLWFDTEAEEAASFYVSVFPNSRVLRTSRYGEAGPREPGMVLEVEFELDGQRLTALNGGPEFTFDEAFSLVVECEDQAEVDYYWDTLSAGGSEGPCGWLKDKYGFSWQVVPKALGELAGDPDQTKGQAVIRTMLGMRKIIVADLRAAYDNA